MHGIFSLQNNKNYSLWPAEVCFDNQWLLCVLENIISNAHVDQNWISGIIRMIRMSVSLLYFYF